VTAAEPSTERLVSQTPGAMCYSISEYVKTRQDGANAVAWTEYQVEDGATVIARGITDRGIAEDIANLPLLKQMVQNGIGGRLVPVQRYDLRSEHDLQVAALQLLEELLAEVKRGNTAERTGAVSSVQIEDAAKGPPRLTTKRYSGSEPEVDEAIADHTRAKAAANERWLTDWQATVEALKS
jgi:hypothetical protein